MTVLWNVRGRSAGQSVDRQFFISTFLDWLSRFPKIHVFQDTSFLRGKPGAMGHFHGLSADLKMDCPWTVRWNVHGQSAGQNKQAVPEGCRCRLSAYFSTDCPAPCPHFSQYPYKPGEIPLRSWFWCCFRTGKTVDSYKITSFRCCQNSIVIIY